jgi:Ca-activated chloride channel homolog
MSLRLFVLAGSLLAAAPAVAQSIGTIGTVPSLSTDGDPHVTFRSSVDLVTLNVTVTDGKDNHLPGLGQHDFQVLEDGVPQALRFFAATNVPLDVALLIDASSSMREKLPLVQQAADRFLKTLRPGDRAQVVAFNSQTRILQALTSDAARLHDAVRQTVARGGTALYTAVYITLDQFMRARSASADLRRPAIVLLTDGQDTSSLIQFDDVLDRARRAGVAIYTIAILSPTEAKTAVELEGGRRFLSDSEYALKTLAKETGGRSFFPLQLSELDAVYGSVASELATQYALGYMPPGRPTDGAFHRVLVRVLSRPDAKLRTRTGYYATRATASLATGK